MLKKMLYLIWLFPAVALGSNYIAIVNPYTGKLDMVNSTASIVSLATNAVSVIGTTASVVGTTPTFTTPVVFIDSVSFSSAATFTGLTGSSITVTSLTASNANMGFVTVTTITVSSGSFNTLTLNGTVLISTNLAMLNSTPTFTTPVTFNSTCTFVSSVTFQSVVYHSSVAVTGTITSTSGIITTTGAFTYISVTSITGTNATFSNANITSVVANVTFSSAIVSNSTVTFSSATTVNNLLKVSSLTVTSSITLNGIGYIFPSARSVSGQVLTGDGSGNLTWQISTATWDFGDYGDAFTSSATFGVSGMMAMTQKNWQNIYMRAYGLNSSTVTTYPTVVQLTSRTVAGVVSTCAALCTISVNFSSCTWTYLSPQISSDTYISPMVVQDPGSGNRVTHLHVQIRRNESDK